VTTLDVATGLAYPAKAERARRNPRVGLLFEGGPGQPIVSVAGLAAVKDADLQANTNRYLSETILTPPVSPDCTDWSITRQAVWYLTRIIISVTPAHIRWWDSADKMDSPPRQWHAPAETDYPKSDPAPGGQISPASQWAQLSWQELAERALAHKGGPAGQGSPGHLTLLDPEGYPLSLRARTIGAIDGGFRLEVPRGAPWSGGRATLSFGGREIFVGDVRLEDGVAMMVVERALPILPIVDDPVQVLQPTPDTKDRLMSRLRQETQRRRQAIPVTPDNPPAPTEGAKLRWQVSAVLMAQMATFMKDAQARIAGSEGA